MSKSPVRPHIRAGRPVRGHQRSVTSSADQSDEVDQEALDAARQAAASSSELTLGEQRDGPEAKAAQADIGAEVNLLTHALIVGDDIPWPVTEDYSADLTESLNRSRMSAIARKYRQFQVDDLMQAHGKCEGLLAVKQCAEEINQVGPEGPEIRRLTDFVDEHWDGAWDHAATELRDLYVDVMYDIHKGVAADLVESDNVEQGDNGQYRLRDRDSVRAHIESVAAR